jgi:imidazoleglycerol phosphate dehydratase HisB
VRGELTMRKASVKRKTTETNISCALSLDGSGKAKIATSIPFLDHMLKLFSMHGGFDLAVKASGDREIDDHHLVEDIGLVLGEAVRKALGDKKGIERYGNFMLPMDEALSYIVVDISGRPYLKYSVKLNPDYKWFKGEFNYGLLEDFFRALAVKAGITLHISLKTGSNNHHIAESIFKGFGRALSQAAGLSPKRKGIPSTKGRI